ncbi:response regulator [Methanobacterium alcaliphilum]|uniref:response regulator n=1 Tax=Methanobacterium alcaliphilum TaxID=392018 RepID=UPI00200A1491|nr:response regulator [Methanobacterium alcaliphilum]MCK9150628.1 PAS domain S-box protein [Methanobacterium alcaliphilum]
MNNKIKVLILEDVPLDAELAERELKKEGMDFVSHIVEKENDFVRELQEFKPDIILADHSLPTFDGPAALKITNEITPHTPFLFVSGKIGEDYAVEMLKKGATDYVLKNNLTKLPHAVIRALKEAEQKHEHLLAEKALKESERKYRTLFEKSKNPIFVCYRDGNLIDFNNAALNFMESEKEQLVNRKINYWVNDNDFENLFLDKTEDMEIIFNINGKEKVLILSSTLIDTDSANTYFLLGKDITMQKIAEKALKKQEEEYRAIFENTGTLFLIFDENMVISLVNSEFEKFSGYHKNEIESKMSWLNFVSPDDLERMEGYQRLQRINPNALPKNYVVSLINRKGTTKTFFATSDIIPATNKGLISFMDITDRKIAEDKIKKSLKEKELLLREIHHRVKNNLQIISTLLTLQSAQVDDEQISEFYNESQNRIQAIALIHEKLYHSQDISKINLTDYIQSMISDLFDSYGMDIHKLEAKLEVDDVLMGIETAIPCGLIINELVSNSLKYAFPDGKGSILISLHKLNDDEYSLMICDNGVGLPENLDLNQTNTLGLQIVNNLVNQIDGVMEISKPSKFKIKFKEIRYKERI